MTDHTDKPAVVLIEGKYGLILLDSRNWGVAELNKAANSIEVNTKDFNPNSYTYHVNIRQAIIEMADRMVKDRIRKGCEGKPLELRELVDIVKEKDQWMRKAIMGRAGSGQP